MKHASVRLIAGLAGALALVASLVVAAAGTAGNQAQAAAKYPAPKVPNAAAIKAKYGGQSITFIGDSVGGSHTRDVALAKQFTKDTGIKVKVVPHPRRPMRRTRSSRASSPRSRRRSTSR